MDDLFTGRHILVVEDEIMVLMTIEGMLVDVGCNSIKTAATVGQALALIETQVFDAALLDVNLNGTASYPVADALEAGGVSFAFATGYNSHSLRAPYSGRPVLRKPFEMKQFVEVFQRIFATAARPV